MDKKLYTCGIFIDFKKSILYKTGNSGNYISIPLYNKMQKASVSSPCHVIGKDREAVV